MKAQTTLEHAGVSIHIYQDEDAQSPQDWGDSNLFLVANHRDFYVPEPGEKRIADDADTLVERYKETHWIFGLESYIHSGVHLSLSNCGNYPDRQWDVSQLGFVFAAKSEWRLSKSARKAAQGLIDTWNQYLSGDVWVYVVDEGGDNEDSCWGFYGHDYCVQEAKGIAEYVAKQKAKEACEVEQMNCRDIVTV